MVYGWEDISCVKEHADEINFCVTVKLEGEAATETIRSDVEENWRPLKIASFGLLRQGNN